MYSRVPDCTVLGRICGSKAEEEEPGENCVMKSFCARCCWEHYTAGAVSLHVRNEKYIRILDGKLKTKILL
jgi:hypothetical protein